MKKFISRTVRTISRVINITWDELQWVFWLYLILFYGYLDEDSIKLIIMLSSPVVFVIVWMINYSKTFHVILGDYDEQSGKWHESYSLHDAGRKCRWRNTISKGFTEKPFNGLMIKKSYWNAERFVRKKGRSMCKIKVIYKTNVVDGLKHGIQSVFDTNSNLLLEQVFENGILVQTEKIRQVEIYESVDPHNTDWQEAHAFVGYDSA